ncbi:fibroin heavy chain [Drosophila madeirensis]
MEGGLAGLGAAGAGVSGLNSGHLSMNAFGAGHGLSVSSVGGSGAHEAAASLMHGLSSGLLGAGASALSSVGSGGASVEGQGGHSHSLSFGGSHSFGAAGNSDASSGLDFSGHIGSTMNNAGGFLFG